MRVLIDECDPKALKTVLAAQGHECLTAQEAGWSGKENGELLVLAEPQFDVLVTLDTNIQYQQKLAGRRIALLIIRARSNRLTYVAQHFPACVEALKSIKPGDVVHVGATA